MPTITDYAAQLAAGDTGEWQAATMRAVELWNGHPWDLTFSTDPDQEIPLRAGALLIYALAGQHDIPESEVTAEQVRQWIGENPSDPAPPLGDALRARSRHIPDPAPHTTAELPADPVAALWVRMTEWHDEPEPMFEIDAIFAPLPGPHLGPGVHRFGEILDSQ